MRPSARQCSAVIALACSLTLLAAGCGGNDQESSAGSGDDDGPRVELTIATFNEFGYSDLYREYEGLHPNVKITERRAETVDDHVKNLETNLAAGSGMADIEAMEVSWIYKYLAKADKFVDLRQYGADDLKERWLDWKVAGATTSEGKIIGYGTDIGPEAICYRKDLFAKAGLPTDRANVAALFPDWDSYFAVGRRFKSKVPNSAWYDSAVLTWEAMRNQLIQAYYSNQDRYLGEENPLLKKTWDQIVRGTDDGLSAKLPAWSPAWTKAFRTDAFATMACPGWLLGVIADNAGSYGKGKWDVANVFPGGGGNWGGSYLTVPTQSPQPEEAAKLAAWLTAPEQQIKVFKKVGSFPSTVDAYDAPQVKSEVNPYFNNAPVGKIFIDRAKSVILKQHKGPRDGEINQVFTEALARVDEGKQKPEDAWRQALDASDKAANTRKGG
ncbi:cellobiose transport system substrate-binding protein [Kribbella orskensis]|uniref:Cellobiose transport system substrate-binding protein n=1 Tax=Kribbella orskensis TaxID=2512216 RepID=A0ABY2BE03_9ACTN|nr:MULTISPECIES: extracellular solute-binding protein [Kribbella]TCN34282.1 cellobiose transport system substrate-binding protein [Kribbella sp. VKM Ac-2500]TCO14412.1 cellobiose transport system substrate-binding protein [Kribbella orskensis]